MPHLMSEIENMAVDSVCRGDLLKHYKGIAKGEVVWVYGAGPSSATRPLDLSCHTILCNSSIKLALGVEPADKLHAISSENRAYLFPWFWGNEEFRGHVLAEKYMGVTMDEEQYSRYSKDWWKRVVWFDRVPVFWTNVYRERGLAFDNTDPYNAIGTVLMQALDLAFRVMEAEEVHTIGAELSFPDGVQHWDGWTPFEYADESVYDAESAYNQCSVVRTDGVRLTKDGHILTTPFFFKSANSIRRFVADNGYNLTDHSGGLLTMPCPEPVLEEDEHDPGL